MKHLGTIIGAGLAGLFVMTVWGAFAGAYGIAGGWFAGLAIIAPMWYMNHFLGIMDNPGGFIDQGMAIGVTGTFIPVWSEGSIQPFVDALPTLGIVIVGAAVGGITAGLLQKTHEL